MNKYGLKSSGVVVNLTCRHSSKSVKCWRVEGGGLSAKVNRPEREVNHLPPLSAQAKNNHLRIFKNMVMRKIFGPKTDEIKGEWEKTT